MDDKYLGILLEIKGSLGGLHEKTDALGDSLMKHEQQDDETHTSVEMRISSLEETRSRARGGYGVLVLLVAIVSSMSTIVAKAWLGR